MKVIITVFQSFAEIPVPVRVPVESGVRPQFRVRVRGGYVPLRPRPPLAVRPTIRVRAPVPAGRAVLRAQLPVAAAGARPRTQLPESDDNLPVPPRVAKKVCVNISK